MLMKKVQILFVLLLTAIVTNAQILKGAKLVGGQVNFRRTESQDPQNGSINSYGVIGLSIGKAYKDNNVWGVNLSYSNSITRYPNLSSANYKITKPGYSMGLFTRNYKKLGGQLYLFTQPELSASFYNEMDKTNNSSSSRLRSRHFDLDLTPGLAYSVTPKIQVELSIPGIAGIGYSYSETKNSINSPVIKSSSFGFNSNLSNLTNLGALGVGFRMIL